MKTKDLTARLWKNTRSLKESPEVPDELQDQHLAQQDQNRFIRSELNLERNSVFTVSTYHGKSREVVIRKTTPTGEISESKVIIGKTIDSVETGVLTTHHFKLYLALIKLWEGAGRPINDPVHFTILKIINLLGMINSGSNYELIKRQLTQLRQIPLTFIESFFMADQETFSSLNPLTILNHLDIYERKNIRGTKKTRSYGQFQFDRHLLESLINNYSHPLRLDVIREFKKHKDLAILLYIYIDRSLAFKTKYQIGLEKLFDHLDLSQSYIQYPSQRKEKIVPVLQQLEGKLLSTGTLSYCRVDKTADGKDYKLICRKKPFAKKLKTQEIPPEFQLPPPTEPEPELEHLEPKSELLSLLIEKGLTEKQAAKLISEKKPEVVKAQLDYFSFRLKDYESQGREINKPAILYDSIKGNWKAPKGYLKAEKEKEREAERLEEEKRARLEQEEPEREEKERERLEAYKERLDPEERARLRERALQEIKSMKGIKDEFINEILIAFSENEILRSKMEE